MATPFQKKVWSALRRIPRGRVTTYGDLARAIRSPRAVRAVGTAVGANPDAPQVPCHRVVRSDGSVGQYAHGVRRKIALLRREGVTVTGSRIADFKRRIFRF